MRIALALSTLAIALAGGKIEWSKLTIDEALAESKKSGKPVLAYFAADACPFCKQQDEQAFSDDEVVRRATSFICVKIDVTDKEARKKAKARFTFIGTPHVIVFDGAGKRLAEFDGLTVAAKFIEKLDTIVAPPKAGVAPSGAQDDRSRQILERIDKEMAEAEKRLRADIAKIVKSELEKAGVAKTTQPPPKDPPAADIDKQIDALIPKLADAGVTGRFKKFLGSKAGKKFVKDQLGEQNQSLEEAMEMYFGEKDGKLTIKEEFADQLEQMLDQIAPAEPPKDPPKPPADPPKPPAEKKPAYLGIFPTPLSDDDRKALGLAAPHGFRLDEVKAGSPAEKAGLKKGDVLWSIGGKKVSEENMGDVMAGFKAGDTAELVIYRGKDKQTIKVTFTEKK